MLKNMSMKFPIEGNINLHKYGGQRSYGVSMIYMLNDNILRCMISQGSNHHNPESENH